MNSVGNCCNNFSIQNGMFISPYQTQDISATAVQPRIKANSGWSNYKNVKSGQYNRTTCWKCDNFKGFPQTPGVYNVNIVDSPPQLPNQQAMTQADINYQNYQRERINVKNGNCYSYYRDYLSEDTKKVYPKRYVKGYWPDEQLIYTNAPK